MLDDSNDDDETDDPEIDLDSDENENGIPDACEGLLPPLPIPETPDEDPDMDTITAKQYIDAVFKDVPGIANVCERAPWRTESLWNVAQFVARQDWSNRTALFSHLKNFQAEYIHNEHDRVGLYETGGTLLSGLTSFHLVSQLDLSVVTDLFYYRTWMFSFKPPMRELWYYNTVADFVDPKGAGAGSCTGPRDELGMNFSYNISMAQGTILEFVLYDVMPHFTAVIASPTLKEWEASDAFLKGHTFGGGLLEDHLHSTPVDDEEAGSGAHERRKLIEEGIMGPTAHKRLLSAASWATGKFEQPYLRDDTEGKGTTIFIIDTGFSMKQPGVSVQTSSLVPRKLTVCIKPSNYGHDTADDLSEWSYIVPNSLSLENIPKDKWKEESIEDDWHVSENSLRPWDSSELTTCV